MDYLVINISAGIMIVLTFVLRKFSKNHLPHTVFSFLWLVIALRLLLPISVETPYSFLNWRIPLEENLIQISMLQREEIYSSISQNLEYVILHEYGHIKYFHPFCKIISMILVSVYWYNPFIWMLYLYLERDMEISSDRFVLKNLKHDYRAEYAKTLLATANRRKKVSIFYYNYNKNFVKERIEAIMNYKKLTAGALVTAMLIPASTVMVFATTDNILTNSEMHNLQVSVLSESQSSTPEGLEAVTLELDWSEIESYVTDVNAKAVSFYTVSNYEYVTYGQTPPSEIDVTFERNGYEYSGTLTLGDFKYQSATDKYTGYYSGKVYRQ